MWVTENPAETKSWFNPMHWIYPPTELFSQIPEKDENVTPGKGQYASAHPAPSFHK